MIFRLSKLGVGQNPHEFINWNGMNFGILGLILDELLFWELSNGKLEWDEQ